MASEGEHRSGDTPRRRQSLRHATVILPQTGERTRRKVTLNRVFRLDGTDGTAPPPPPPNHDERTPLLPRAPSDADSTPDAERDGVLDRIKEWTRSILCHITSFLQSRNGRNVIKCSLAYLLASLAVFIPWIARLLGPGDNKHLVANVIVWYNPARSVGSMTQGTLFASLAFIFSATVIYTSMGVATLFHHLDMVPLGHVIILAILCGGSLGFMSWVRQRMGDILVNVSVALASIPIVTTITKDPAIHVGFVSHVATSQMLRMAVLGISISTIVTVIIWPISARADLLENLSKATDDLAVVLASTTSSFLSGNEDDMADPQVMTTAIKKLTNNLAEASNEYYLVGLERQYALEQRLVRCIQSLAHDIGGLQSAASTQFSLLHESTTSFKDTREASNGKDAGKTTATKSKEENEPQDEPSKANTPPQTLNDPKLASLPKGNSMSSIITMIRGQSARAGSSSNNSSGAMITDHDGLHDGIPIFSAENADDIFEFFLESLGPPMKSLAYTLQQILLEVPFGPGPDYRVANNSNFRSSLRAALELFTSSRKAALAAVYKSKQISLEKSYWVAADFEEVAASCGHFSSSLQDLAENVVTYLDILDELEEETTERSRGRSWQWLIFWRKSRQDFSIEPGSLGNMPTNTQANRDVATLPTSLSEIPSSAITDLPMAAASIQTTLRWRVWVWLSFMRRDDIRFAVKVGAGGALFASLAFIPRIEELFFHWRLEWSLATYMVACSMTIGAANTTTVKRLIGAAIGALLALLVWVLSDDSPYVLAFLGWLVGLGCFFLMIVLGQAPMSRFILLTYNLSVLYSFTLSVADKDDGDEDEGGINPAIYEIVLHRLIAVSIGCIYSLLVTRLIWPISARKKLKSGLSLLWLRMALIWKRKPLSLLTDAEMPPSYLDIREEFRLREFAGLLEMMRTNAESEFTLRRAFPTAAYGRILKSTGRMLDALHALNVVISKDLSASAGELALLRYTVGEREQLAMRIAHLLSVLASSIKLEYPLTDTMPEIEHTRDRLLARIFAFRQDGERSAGVADQDYELLYTYTLVTGQLAKEVMVVSREMEGLYGTVDENITRLQ